MQQAIPPIDEGFPYYSSILSQMDLAPAAVIK